MSFLGSVIVVVIVHFVDTVRDMRGFSRGGGGGGMPSSYICCCCWQTAWLFPLGIVSICSVGLVVVRMVLSRLFVCNFAGQGCHVVMTVSTTIAADAVISTR